MIDVRRFDYEERKNKSGKVVCSAFHECFYTWHGQTIAWYTGRDDTIYLSTKLLGNDFKKSYFDRMKESANAEGFKELIELLSIDENTKLSEFCNM